MNNATYEDFLARLKEERLRLGLSQDDIGRLLRMTQSHYSKAELGSRRFTYYELQCLCDTDVDVFYLFTGHRFESVNDENMKKKPMGKLIFYMNTLCNLISYLDGEEAIALSENDRKKIRYIQSSQIRMGDSRTGLFWLRTVLDYNQFKMAGILLDNAEEAVKDKSDRRICVEIYDRGGRGTCFKVRNVHEYVPYSSIQGWFEKGVSSKGTSRGLGLYHLKLLLPSPDNINSLTNIRT